ncbi:MAG TPA: COR domain-containing protein [Herpetosiphonaceae bacterium]
MTNSHDEDAMVIALQRIEEVHRNQATELNLSLLGLTELPEFLWNQTQLQVLNLSFNQLIGVPEGIRQLQQLQILNLSFNQLTGLSEAVGQLQQLQVFHLMDNQLQEIPAAVGQLQQLQQLDLGNNRLREIPAAVGQLQQLQRLYMSDNQLREVPAAVGQLQQLQQLNLANNQLTSLPEFLKELASLTELYLHGNDQLRLPPEILGPSPGFLFKGEQPADPSLILDYYMCACTGRPLNEAKLLLVGRRGVGKTSLVNQLVYGEFAQDEKKVTGTQITKWERLLHGRENIQLNLWDIGDHEIMDVMHQFFFTQRSVYLLVVNGRESSKDADAEYWLKQIKSFGGESSVIIVLHKIKQQQFDLNYRALQQKYPNIREFVKTDCEDSHSIEELRKVIDREVDRLKHLQYLFPVNWFEIKECLQQMQQNYLEFEKYRECCISHRETNNVRQQLLAHYLHQIGIIVNYKDDPRLQDTHVLNPHWVTAGIYKILNSEKLARQKGQIHLNEVDSILDPRYYPRKMCRFIFDLMKKFDLCFSFPDDECQYLVPELLDEREPQETEAFDPEQCLNFQYHYSMLPEGLLPRFIVRTHHLSEKLSRWRTGIILEFDDNRALVKADMKDKKVLICVSGSREGRRRLLTLIRVEFDIIHRALQNLQPQEMVPLPKRLNIVPYRKLLVMEKKGRKEFPWVFGDEVIDLDVANLLEHGVGLGWDLAKERIMDGKTEAVRVFYSYSHKDEQLRNDLETHLKLLHRQGLIESWKDRQIEAGEEWKDKIDENLERADIILLLISADFIASDYCYEKEMKRALQKHQDGSARVIPVILRTCNWHKAPFGKLQALPRDAKPITTWSDRDTAWADAAAGIERVVETLQKKRRS